MCKIAVFPLVKENKQTEAWKLAVALTPLLTAQDNDGFGYMAFGDKGLYGERWVNVKQAWRARKKVSDIPPLVNYSDVLYPIDGYNMFGERGKNRTYSIALHARKATCGVSLANTHPFLNGKATLGIIHNGIITNSHMLGVPQHGCDSEAILSLAHRYNVNDDMEHWQNVVDELSGWWAVAAFSQNDKGKWHLDIVHDHVSDLYAGYVDQLEALVFCTSQEVLKKAAKSVGMTVSSMYEVVSDVALRHDVLTGSLIETMPLERVKYETESSRSIGLGFSEDAEVVSDFIKASFDDSDGLTRHTTDVDSLAESEEVDIIDVATLRHR